LLDFLITQPLLFLRDVIAPYIPYSATIFCYFCELLNKIFTYNIPFAILTLPIIIFNVIPRLVVSLVFFIELVIYQRIYYFVSCLILLLIPIIWNIFIDLFTNFGQRALIDIPKYINVIPEGEPLNNGWYHAYTFEYKSEYQYEENDKEEYKKLWYLALKIYAYGECYFKKYQQIISPYVIIYCSSLYVTATLYKLFFLFY
jgi:hypothetical protein